MEKDKTRVKQGIVKEYDQIEGIIITEEGKEYTFVDRDVETELEEGNAVMFFAEDIRIDDEIAHVARYVRKRKNNERKM